MSILVIEYKIVDILTWISVKMRTWKKSIAGGSLIGLASFICVFASDIADSTVTAGRTVVDMLTGSPEDRSVMIALLFGFLFQRAGQIVLRAMVVKVTLCRGMIKVPLLWKLFSLIFGSSVDKYNVKIDPKMDPRKMEIAKKAIATDVKNHLWKHGGEYGNTLL